ncbi:tRNA dihydrouridine(20/20a) synthase DusA [Buchnera aphidicola (Mindarus keteleerifoliae)]|uniref:tRNA dihydrouridine(20/20a) synthase DusA n=1 Tax=Buchnera aphidicola TaxID=9 RepID=UPI0031B6D51C
MKNKKKKISNETYCHKFSVAPMLNYTNKHCRHFYRKLTKKSLLYTEMIVANGPFEKIKKKIIYNSKPENPISIQLAGRIPKKIAKCAKLAYLKGYNEINLNIGCPSKKVNKSHFGISLMNETNTVRSIIKAISEHVSIPITIKTRIGINHQDSYNFLSNFIYEISKDNICKTFIIHARKALVFSLNTKKNFKIPKINYEFVYNLKKDFPNLMFIINGNIKSISSAKKHLKKTDGVMLGRAVYNNPSILKNVDNLIFNEFYKTSEEMSKIIQSMYPYIEKELLIGTSLYQIARHFLNAFYGMKGSSFWKKYLCKNATKNNADLNVLETGLELMKNNYFSN